MTHHRTGAAWKLGLARSGICWYSEAAWIDLDAGQPGRLLATTIKKAKGESAFRVSFFGPVRYRRIPMSVSEAISRPGPVLCGSEGELCSLRIEVEPRLLEELLEALAELPFPVNPQIHHQPTAVEFPAYGSRLGQVWGKLAQAGLATRNLAVLPMIQRVGDGSLDAKAGA
jgi:hypothetical protein